MLSRLTKSNNLRMRYEVKCKRVTNDPNFASLGKAFFISFHYSTNYLKQFQNLLYNIPVNVF